MKWDWLGEAGGRIKALVTGAAYSTRVEDVGRDTEQMKDRFKEGWTVEQVLGYDSPPPNSRFKGAAGKVLEIGGTKVPFGPSGKLDQDLVEHWYNSQQIQKDLGIVPAAAGGVLHEIFNIFQPESTGFSSDDLLANFAGFMGYDAEQAAQAGVFDHTRDTGKGFRGQGSWKENWEKLKNLGLPEGSFPTVSSGIDKIKGLISQGTTSEDASEDTETVEEVGEDKPDRVRSTVTGTTTGKGRTKPTTTTTPYVTPYVGDPTGRTAKPDPFRFEDTKTAARGRRTSPTTTTTRGRPPRRSPHG